MTGPATQPGAGIPSNAPASVPACVETSLTEGVLRIVMAQPETRNALSEAMIAQLRARLDEAAADQEVRCIVITARGPAFSAGHHLKELTARRADADGGRAYFAWLMAECSALMQSIVSHPRPVIAEVQGVAAAAGCQLVASCDLAIAADTACFTTPGVHIGLFCSTPMVALSRNMARKHAMEMLLTGDMIPADEAARMGLINRAVPAARVCDEVAALAAKIAGKSASVVKTGKTAFYRQLEMPLTEAYEYCSDVMVNNMLDRESREGIGAFIEKRPPHWHT